MNCAISDSEYRDSFNVILKFLSLADNTNLNKDINLLLYSWSHKLLNDRFMNGLQYNSKLYLNEAVSLCNWRHSLRKLRNQVWIKALPTSTRSSLSRSMCSSVNKIVTHPKLGLGGLINFYLILKLPSNFCFKHTFDNLVTYLAFVKHLPPIEI